MNNVVTNKNEIQDIRVRDVHLNHPEERFLYGRLCLDLE
jgi:hypothetical protein